MKIYANKVLNVAVILASIPTFLFLTWYKWQLFLLGSTLLGIACCRVIKKNNVRFGETSIYIQKHICMSMILFLVFISFFSGVGGWFPQAGDHVARNPILYDLIMYEWPVIYSEMNTGLVYYLGFFLLPAITGKLFGNSLFVGNLALTLSLAVYLIIIVLLIIVWLHIEDWKMQMATSLIVVVFSGLNYIGRSVNGIFKNTVPGIINEHTEWYAPELGMVYVGNFVAIRQTFNHFIPVLLIVCLYICMRDRKNYLFLGMLLLIGSPFGTIALAVTMVIDAIYAIIKEVNFSKDKNRKKVLFFKVKELFSIENILAIPVAMIVLPYYIGGASMRLGIIRNEDWLSGDSLLNTLHCIGIILAECGILLLVLWKDCRKDILYKISAVFLLMIPFFEFTDAIELMLKPTAVWLVILMLLLIKDLQEVIEKKDIRRLLILYTFVILCIVNFGFECGGILRTIYQKQDVSYKRNVVETLGENRTINNVTFMDNYVKRNPAFDLFFGKLSKGNFSTIDNIDIILDEDNYIDKVVWNSTKDNLSIMEKMEIPETILEGGIEIANGISQMDLSEYDIHIDTVAKNNSYDVELHMEDANLIYKVNRNAQFDPEFMHISLKNIGDAIFPEEYTGKAVGVLLKFYDLEGNGVSTSIKKPIECILRNGETTQLTIPIVSTPEVEGTYKMKMWIYEGKARKVKEILLTEVKFE